MVRRAQYKCFQGGSSLSEAVAYRRKGIAFGGSSLSETVVYVKEVLLVSFLGEA